MAKIMLVNELEEKCKKIFQKPEQKEEVGKVVRSSKNIRVIDESPRRPHIYILGAPEINEGKLPKV